jgi:hypothetical protein
MTTTRRHGKPGITTHLADRATPAHPMAAPPEAQTLAPSADNIAVLFPPAPLPEWERYDDGV